MAESTAAALSSAAAAAPPKLIQQPSISLKQAPVCFGDSVVLFENDLKGYVYVENPVNASVLLVPSEKDDDNKPALANVKATVFQLIAPNKYKSAKRMRKLLKTYKKANLDTEDNEITELNKLVSAEAKDNDLEQQRQRGRSLVYGQVVELRHEVTKMFLHVSATDAASLDVTATRATLSPDTSKNTFFRIMPRFKVRSEGDTVRYGDQIMLESIKSSGQFIHVGAKKFGQDKVNAGTHEVNLSVNKTSFVIKSYVLHTHVGQGLEINQTHLRGGDVINLLHKESDSYLTAEGSFTGLGEFEDVHMRRRKEKSKDSTIHCNLGITFWQVEHFDDSTSGEVVRWNKWIRLRNMCTKRYLRIKQTGTDSYVVSTTLSGKDPSCRFSFHPVTRESVEVPYPSFCRIQHVLTEHWLHVTDSKYKLRQYSERKHDSLMDALQWDNATFRTLSVMKEMRYDDAYAILPVAHETLQDFNYVAGCAPTIVHHMRLLSTNADIDNVDQQTIIDTLQALKSFLTEDDSVRRKSKQKVFRHLRVVDILVLLLKAPFQAPPNWKNPAEFNSGGIKVEIVNEYSRIVNVCKVAYTVLTKYLEGSHKNKLYLARHIPFFQTQIGYDLNTASMLMKLVSDNRMILDRIEEVQIHGFIDWLEKRNDPAFLNFLDVICVCKDKPISSTQLYVAKELMAVHQRSALLYETRLAGTQEAPIIEIQLHTKPRKWVNLAAFAERASKKEAAQTDKDEYEYFLAQLVLFSSICKGRNTANIEMISTKFVSLDQCLTALTDEHHSHGHHEMPPRLRSMYCQLLINAFINVAPNWPILNHVKLTFAWSNVQINKANVDLDPGVSLTQARISYFSKLHEFIIKHLKLNKHMIASHIDENVFTGSVLELTRYLVLFGYYSDTDYIKHLLVVLFDCLDLRTDKKSSKQSEKDQKEWIETGDCFKESPQNNAMAEAKYWGALIMEALFNYRMGSRIKAFLIDFKLMKEQHDKNVAAKRGLNVIMGRLRESMPHLATLLPAFVDDPKHPVSTEVVLNYLDELFSRENYLDIVDESNVQGRLVPIFLELARYHNHKLTFMATNIVNRHFTGVWDLFEKASTCRLILTNESTQCSNIVTTQLYTLRLFVGSKLLTSDYATVLNAITTLTELCSIKTDPLEVNE